MQTLHAKSPCCRGRINHFGKRRRQCSLCKRTWRIRLKRRGRKRRRITSEFAIRTLVEHRTFAHQPHYRHISQSGFSRRLTKALQAEVKTRYVRRMPSGPSALLGDGLYFKFQRVEWVLYVMAVKPASSHKAFFLDPVLLPGRECYERWQMAVDSIPKKVKEHVVAFVSDGFRGSKLLATEHGWLAQRCHFHLLAALVRRHGRRTYRLKGAKIREQLLVAIRIMLVSTKNDTLKDQRTKIKRLLKHEQCPRYIRKQTIEFLRSFNDFRTYLSYPALNLPTTTNAIESTGKLIRRATSTARTPQSVLLRARAFLRLRKSITCNGKSSTKLNH